jgi:hypothetical protein
MNVEILSPSPISKKRKPRLTVDHVMPGDVITADPGFMRYTPKKERKEKKRKEKKRKEKKRKEKEIKKEEKKEKSQKK